MLLCRSPAIRALLSLALAGLLGSCATDRQRTRTEGAVTGAAAGAVLGRAIGGDNRGAVLGAALGGVVGALLGNRAAGKKAAYARREEDLRASAQRAAAMAQSSREQNDALERDIVLLGQSIQELQTAKLSAVSRQALVAEHRQRLGALLAATDAQLHQMRSELERQSALLAAVPATTDRETKVAGQESSEGFRLVSVGMRDLEQQTRRLELARLQLQQIDQRRAF